MKNLFLFLLTIGFFFSCSNKKIETTKASLVIGAAFGTPETAGGMMIYGRSLTNGQTFGKRVVDANTSLELPNGVWDFIGITWDGANGQMTGIPRCANIDGVVLDGGEVSVALNFSTPNCSQSVFGVGEYAANAGGWPNLSVISCGNLMDPDDYGAFPDPSTGGVQGCIPTTSTSPSYQVVLPQTNLGPDFTGIAPGGVISACSDFNITGTFISTTTASAPTIDIQVPYFNAFEDSRIPTRIILFENSGCTGPSETFLFASSLSSNGPGPGSRVYSSGGMNTAVVRGTMCGGSRLSPAKYSGAEAITAPEMNPICTPQQLANISSNMVYNSSKNFLLASDIDLGLYGDFSAEMIGQGANPYSGEFIGKGRSIYGLSIFTTAQDDIGLFSQLGAGALVEDIALISPIINTDGANRVGSLIGNALSGSAVKNIYVSDASVTSTSTAVVSDIGGIIGRGTSMNFERSRSVRPFIDVDNAAGIGGAIGTMSTSPTNGTTGIKTVESIDALISKTGTNQIQDVGGLVGFLDNSGLYEVSAKNVSIVMNDGLNIGGVFGRAVNNTGGTELTNLFASGYIDIFELSATIGNIGGIGGQLDSDNTFNFLTGLYSDVNIVVDNGDLGPLNTGGIFGYLFSTTNYPTYIIAAKNSGDVSCIGDYCGGLIGYGTIGTDTNLNIINSLNTGLIYSEDSDSIGGIAGNFKGNITASGNNGDVTVFTSGNSIGGLVGTYIQGKISNSFNKGIISGSGTLVGGFAGSIPGTGVIIQESLNMGTVNGATSFYADLGSHASPGNCGVTLINNHTTVAGTICTTAGEVDFVSTHSTSTDFPNLFFSDNTPNPITGTLGLNTNGNLIGTGTSLQTEVALGSYLMITGSDPDQNLLPVYALSSTTTGFTSPSNYQVLAQGSAVNIGPWVYDPIEGPQLLFQDVADMFTPNQLGTSSSPILINSPADFNKIYKNPFLMNKTFRLTNNINFGGGNISPIGTRTYPFQGSFQGDNFTIGNGTINLPSLNDVGLFRAISSNARIDSWDELTGREGVLYLDNITSIGFDNVGILVGAALDDSPNGGSFYISNTVVMNSSADGSTNVGGVLGNTKVTNSFSRLEGLVNLSTTVTSSTNAAGGITGRLIDGAGAQLTNLGNTGSITGALRVGGIVGLHEGAGSTFYKNIGNLGNITATGNQAGGIIGSLGGTGGASFNGVFNRYNTVTTPGVNAGGLVGYATVGSSFSHSFIHDTTISSSSLSAAFVGGGTSPTTLTNCFSLRNSISPALTAGKHFFGNGVVAGATTCAQDVPGDGTLFGPDDFIFGGSAALRTVIGNDFMFFQGQPPQTREEPGVFNPLEARY